MVDSLPKLIDPVALAERHVQVTGSLCVDGFDRLAEFLYHRNGLVNVNLVFMKTDGRSIIEGQIDAVLQLKCQRCLEAIEWLVNSDIHLGVVQSLNQADKLPKEVEPLLLEFQDKVELAYLVEDELLLNLPAFPKHSHDCLELDNVHQNAENKYHQVRKNVFSKLAVLIQPENSNGSTKK